MACRASFYWQLESEQMDLPDASASTAARALRVLVVAQHYPPEITAAAFRWSAIARAWAAAGADVTVLTGFPNYPSGRIDEQYKHLTHLTEELDGVRVERVWTIPASGRGIIKRSISQFFFYFAGRAAASRLRPFDVVVGTSPPLPAAELGAHLAKARGVPFVMEVRDLWPDVVFDSGYSRLAPFKGRLYAWERSLYGRASMIAVVTAPFVDIIAAKGVDRQRIAVFPPGFDFAVPTDSSAAQALREQLGLQGKLVALYLGNHGESQGLDVLIESAAALPASVHLLFVGDGWVKPDLVARASELGLANVTFLPAIERSRVADYYGMADLCLVTLRGSELLQHFLPSKLIEVLAYGKHVLTNIGGEGAALIRSLNAGVVLDEFTPAAVANALSGWAQNARNFAESEQIRDLMKLNYDQRNIALEYLDAVRRVAQRER
jgi:colanic acid biosynthesis glycosyl transferase WcaI